jgi:tRNA pseudouridine55 synthase
VDKPSGPTSHDVVARVRRALRTSRVGHAGTLDPMASGVLVVLVGEATKLAPYLTAHDKGYEATVVLGRATDTLDAEGRTTLEGPLPDDVARAIAQVEAGGAPTGPVAAALAAELARITQIPPSFSAIKVDGERSYARARAGEEVELAARAVEVRSLRVTRAAAARDGAPATVDLVLEVSKGYYVRSLARDLGEHLGVPAHLGRLRRTRSGPFALAASISLDAAPDALRAALIPLSEAAALGLPVARLTAEGVTRAGHGKRLSADHFVTPPTDAAHAAWLDEAGRLRAVGTRREDEYIVERGFCRSAAGGDAPDATAPPPPDPDTAP